MVPKTRERDPDEYYDRREKRGEDEMFCINCGSIVKRTGFLCPSCGTMLKYNAYFPIEIKHKTFIGESLFLSILICVLLCVYVITANPIWVIACTPFMFGWIVILWLAIEKNNYLIKQLKSKENSNNE